MLKFFSAKNSWYNIAFYSLLCAVSGGLILRLQYSGFFADLTFLDFRRAHSHLGFFGFLFPMIWHHFEKSKFWICGQRLKIFYCLLLVLSTVGFLVSGYGILAHISSALVLVVWLFFAVSIYSKVKGLAKSIPISIMMAALSVVCLAVLTGSGQNVVPWQLVRIFLTILVFGVFGSVVAEKLSVRSLSPFLWVGSVLGTGVFLSQTRFSEYFSIFPAILGLCILYCLFNNKYLIYRKRDRIRIYYIILGITFILISFGFIPNNRSTAISGIHYFIFLIFINLFFYFKKRIFQVLFEFSALLMVLFIFLPNFYDRIIGRIQILLSFVSIILVIITWLGIDRCPVNEYDR